MLGWPLGPTDLREPTVSANILGDVDEPEEATLYNVDSVLDESNANIHWYGKTQARPLRKMGHVTVTDPEEDDRDALLDHTESLRDGLTFVDDKTQ